MLFVGPISVSYTILSAYFSMKPCTNLGIGAASEILAEILEEEKTADETLTEVAETVVNIEAAGERE